MQAAVSGSPGSPSAESSPAWACDAVGWLLREAGSQARPKPPGRRSALESQVSLHQKAESLLQVPWPSLKRLQERRGDQLALCHVMNQDGLQLALNGDRSHFAKLALRRRPARCCPVFKRRTAEQPRHWPRPALHGAPAVTRPAWDGV